MSRPAVAAAVETCPRCSGPITSWGCRPVPLGDFCWTYGLAEDLSRRPPAPVDPVSAAVEQDRNVRKAAEGLAAAMDAEEGATSNWERAALEGWRARARVVAESKDVFTAGGELTSCAPADLSDRELRRLEEAEAEAEDVRRRAGLRVVAARQQLEDARLRARRKLSR